MKKVALSALIIISSTSFGHCGDLFKWPWTRHSSQIPRNVSVSAKSAACEWNAQQVLLALRKGGEDISQSTVVLATKYGYDPSRNGEGLFYTYHVFVIHRGKVYDPNVFEKKAIVHPQDLFSYLRDMPFAASSRLLTYDANNYISFDMSQIPKVRSIGGMIGPNSEMPGSVLTKDWIDNLQLVK